MTEQEATFSTHGHIRDPAGTCIFCGQLVPNTKRSDQWDAWYGSLPDDLKRRLSLHDFKRLGDLFKNVFEIGDKL